VSNLVLLAVGMANEALKARAELQERFEPNLEQMLQLVLNFLTQPITPEATQELEQSLEDHLRDLGREVLEWVFQQIEPADPQQMPDRIEVNGQTYRRRKATKNRGGVGTRFGVVELVRFLYEPVKSAEQQGERIPSIFPLEWDLGIVAGNATPALAERTGELAAAHSQAETLRLLGDRHAVCWSVDVLRNVIAAVSQGIESVLLEIQKARLLSWLRQAASSRGRRKIVLAAGRDGIMLPIRGEPHYKEGAVGTLAVFDRRGRRLGTVYLGQMPEAYQKRLSTDLTRLLQAVLSEWDGPAPRLVYITDAGYHPTRYFEEVLLPMEDPRRPGRRLEWTWVVDFYHASGYLKKLADALFENTLSANWWYRQMRHRLKHESNALHRILHSAARYRQDQNLSDSAEENYQKAYNYLKKHKPHMDYATYRRWGLPIGSGITEAACKTVFTQRFKASGMSWKCDSGQRVLVLRLAWLSGVWQESYQAWLRTRQTLNYSTQGLDQPPTSQIAA
jgi:hypothetical protein